ncbi:hypothetical protein [Ruegeria sp. HKCCD8929]|uniref:hypothetical protein n=1 Tax=Ruegeria sp. HKCCD8929 TaxID=2683006 RepID=UPI0014888BA8|nr:hypothetical protein [Ruegeria sp. HKCCD8929]
MGQDEFQARLQRISAKQPSTSVPKAAKSGEPARGAAKSSVRAVVFGAICSLIVLVLFLNIQSISDMAPESVRQSETPGAYGLPVAILAIAWFTLIPIWFVGSVLMKAMRGSGRLMPSAFVLGAFISLCLGLGAVQVLGAGGVG